MNVKFHKVTSYTRNFQNFTYVITILVKLDIHFIGLPREILFGITKECGCCFSLVTLGVNMRYSDIKKCCNSQDQMPPLPSCLVLPSGYPASEVESLFIERL